VILAALGAALLVLVNPDPGTSAANATVHAGSATAQVSRDNRASLSLAPGAYDVVVEKPGFVPARARVVVTGNGATVRIALHAAQASALRTIGAVAAAERGAFNRAPDPVAVLPREGYRDQGQPGTTTVLTQTPAIAVDRAGRNLGTFDEPPVALVRGGTPLETQVLLEGVPVALPTTRTLALSAIPAFVTQEVEVHPGQGAPLPTIDGALNGSLNVRFAEPTPVWRALPEVGADGRGGSFADLAAGGATANRRIGVAFAAVSNGAKGTVADTDTIQRALLLKARASLSPAATFTATGYSEADSDRFNRNGFGFTTAELRVSGARDTVLARWWHASAIRDGAAAGDPLVFRTEDALTGASLELDHARGDDLLSLGVTETYGLGSADGAVFVAAGAHQRVRTAFARAILHPARRVETQLALYDFSADMNANGRDLFESGLLGRVGIAYRASPRTTLRASVGGGFTPPSLVALAGLSGAIGPTGSGTADIGIEQRVIDDRTTLSADVFATRDVNRLVEGPLRRRIGWVDAGTAVRRGAEISLARRAPSGLGFLLQAWTASETPALTTSIGDVASGATHGYAEISYHGVQGSRVSLGATYWGADPSLAQPATVLLNTNVEIQVGARGKIQLSVENLNDAARAVTTSSRPLLPSPSAFAPGPRTVRLLLRRSFGRAGADG
jgi:TonB dependent receptor/TonB-dependent Receptor Plug Domain